MPSILPWRRLPLGACDAAAAEAPWPVLDHARKRLGGPGAAEAARRWLTRVHSLLTIKAVYEAVYSKAFSSSPISWDTSC